MVSCNVSSLSFPVVICFDVSWQKGLDRSQAANSSMSKIQLKCSLQPTAALEKCGFVMSGDSAVREVIPIPEVFCFSSLCRFCAVPLLTKRQMVLSV